MIAFLVGLAILGGVTSQSLMDTATTCLFLFFLKDIYFKKISFKSVKPIGIEWALAGYFTIAIISLLINGKEPVPWYFYLSKFNWVLNLYLFIYAFNQIHFDYKKWFYFFSLAFIAPNMYALFTYFKGYDYLTQQTIKGATGLVESATYHAHGNSLIFVVFASLFVFMFSELSKKEKLSTGLALILMSASIFVTYTRGIWGATFISLLVMTFLKNKKTGFLFTVSAIAIGCIVYLNSTDIQHRLNASFSTGSDHTRFELLQVHWQMFKAHPFIGIGFFESYRQIADYWPMIGLTANHFESHAHNQYLNVLATTGLIGFVFFISIFVYFIRLTLKMINANTQLKLNYAISISILILILQFALACLTDVTFEYAKIRGLLVIGLALLISLKFKTKQDLL